PWLLEQERVKNPKKVRVRAGELRNASAHWVEILLNERPWEGMNVDAEILANNIIRVDSDNVLKLKISPPQEFINAHERLNVVWNGRITTFENPQEYILLENKKTRPPTLQKTPGLAGPIKDFINTPFAMVIGTTSKDSLMQRIINQKADAIIASWKDWQNFEPRVFKDVEITKQDIQKYSLYLLGGIEENKVSKMLWSELPIKISNDMVGIFGQTYQAKDAVVDIVYPNPLNSDRYVRLVLPTSSKGMYFFDPELDNLKDNDFYIADGKIPNSRAGFPQGKITLASGRFNYNWELDKAYLQMGNPELRANCLTTIIHDDFTTSIRGAIVVSPDLLKSYVGLYYFEARNFRLQVMMENGKFLGQGPDGRAMEMHALSETDFIVPELDIQLSFVRDEASSEAILIIYQQDSEMEGKKIKSVHHEK
ncbi:MAG: hypothetical protein QGG64_17385, partial [Candidatus Latescibacteria bacterium]|nr:hypothetical protein [Candidatus Latescibacterota bacterium]